MSDFENRDAAIAEVQMRQEIEPPTNGVYVLYETELSNGEKYWNHLIDEMPDGVPQFDLNSQIDVDVNITFSQKQKATIVYRAQQ